MALTDEERAMLELERQWFAHRGAKEGVILDRFGMSPTRYYQRLFALVQTQAAMEHDPITCRRVLRLVEKRRP